MMQLKNTQNVEKIFIDMDGCIVDDMQMFQQLKPTIKNIEDHISVLKIIGKKEEFVMPLILEAIDRKLFEKAKPTLFLTALKDLLIPYWKSLGIEVEILSSTMSVNPKREELVRQKLSWCKQHIPGVKVNLTEGSRLKKEYAKSNVLLIDDYDRTIAEFIRAGGFGIQYIKLNSVINQLRLIGLVP